MAKRDRKNEFDTDAETAEAETDAVEEADTEGLVKMHKNGESLHVHPTTVKDHQDKGWKVA